jgi:type IV secretory pathway VirB3-like protein
MIALTGAFFIVELVVGQVSKSLSLVADSFHMLSDLVSMIVGVVAIWVRTASRFRPDLRHVLRNCNFAHGEFFGANSYRLHLDQKHNV